MSLFEQACAVRENAHAPYSGFKVGAALRSSSGKTFVGCNVENAAYPEGTCAEAGAIAAMVAAGESEIEEICIVAGTSSPVSPCGGCRQKISEFSKPDTVVLLANPNGETVRKSAGELLPDSFKPSHLEE
jgi:cytidine deaminase